MKTPEMPHFQAVNSLESLVLDSFGLSAADIQFFTAQKKGPINFLHICLEPTYPKCPDCGYEHPIIFSYANRRISHDFLIGKNSILLYRQRRYRCPDCGRTYIEKNPFTFRRQRVSVQTVGNVLDDLKSPSCTYRECALKHNLSPTTVQNIFDRHVNFPDHPSLPEFMIMDEVYAFQSRYTGYVCLFIDGKTGMAIDVLPTRRKDDLIEYFRAYPIEEREKVKFFSSDMYQTYQELAKYMFPEAVCAVDRFHVRKLFTDRAQAIRISIMKGFHLAKQTPEQKRNYSLLKNYNDLLFVNRRKRVEGINGTKVPIFDPNAKKEYSSILRYKTNKLEIMQRICAIDPRLQTIRDISDLFDDFFKCSNKDQAAKVFKKIISALENSLEPELMSAAESMNKWKEEILNSFTVVGKYYETNNKNGHLKVMERKLNSGLIENRNRIIKIMKNSANGFKNWERFRNRVLYVLNRREPSKNLSFE